MVEVVHDGDAHYRVVGVVVAFFSREGKTMVWTRIPVFFFGKELKRTTGSAEKKRGGGGRRVRMRSLSEGNHESRVGLLAEIC